MLACRQVAKALADGDYAKLPRWRRMALKLHVALCAMCGRYHRQVMVMQDGVRCFLDREEDIEAAAEPGLSEEGKRRINDAMRS